MSKYSSASKREKVCFTARSDGKNFKPVKIKFYLKNKEQILKNNIKEIKILLKEIEEL